MSSGTLGDVCRPRASVAMMLGWTIAIQAVAARPTVSGDVVLTTAPHSLNHNAFESDDNIAIVVERSSVSLLVDLLVDVDGTPGTYDELSDLTGGIISAGTKVSSHILHFDPVGEPGASVLASGSATFSDGPIIGLILTQTSLESSDFLGSIGTSYGGQFRQFELPAGFSVSDQVTISPDRRSVIVNFGATTFYDELRVLILVPEPTAFANGSLLLMMCLVMAHRKKVFH